MDHELIIRYIDKLGFPTAVAVAMAWVLYRVLNRLADAHIKRLDSADTAQQVQTNELQQQTSVLHEINRALPVMCRAVCPMVGHTVKDGKIIGVLMLLLCAIPGHAEPLRMATGPVVAFIEWSKDGFLDRHSLAQSCPDCARFETGNFGPICNAFCLVIAGKHHGIPLVSGLLINCRPTAIARLINSVVVREAVDGVFFGRGLSHVGKESREGILPCWKDDYPSAAIVGIICGVLVVTPAKHPLPALVFKSAAKPMRGISGQQLISAKASATSDAWTDDVPRRHNNLLPTLAPTKPRVVFVAVFPRIGNHKDTTKP